MRLEQEILEQLTLLPETKQAEVLNFVYFLVKQNQTADNHSQLSQRPIGLFKNNFSVPKSFFEPLPEALLRAFEGRRE